MALVRNGSFSIGTRPAASPAMSAAPPGSGSIISGSASVMTDPPRVDDAARCVTQASKMGASSGAARGAGAIGPHYNASKAGMEGLTRGYAARLVKEGITVNAVAPSLIETDMMKGQPQLISRIPLGRFGQPEEVAKAVTMLIDNPYMTGQTIAMSGGMAFN